MFDLLSRPKTCSIASTAVEIEANMYYFFYSMHVVSTHVCIVHGFLSLLPSLRGLPGHRAATVYNKPAANTVGTGPISRKNKYRNEGNANLDGLVNKLWDKPRSKTPPCKQPWLKEISLSIPCFYIELFSYHADAWRLRTHKSRSVAFWSSSRAFSFKQLALGTCSSRSHRNIWISTLSSSSKHTLVNLLQALFERNIHSSQGALVTKKERTFQCCQVL